MIMVFQLIPVEKFQHSKQMISVKEIIITFISKGRKFPSSERINNKTSKLIPSTLQSNLTTDAIIKNTQKDT